jgi:hypothetical protein
MIMGSASDIKIPCTASSRGVDGLQGLSASGVSLRLGCMVAIRLNKKLEDAAMAHRIALSEMKKTRGQEFERAWRLVEQRKARMQEAQQSLRRHELEHCCDS